MLVQAMTNHLGQKSANNFIIQDNKGNMYMQSYNEIVAVKKGGEMFVKKSALERSKTTKRYMESFINTYGNTTVNYVDDEEFSKTSNE